MKHNICVLLPVCWENRYLNTLFMERAIRFMNGPLKTVLIPATEFGNGLIDIFEREGKWINQIFF